MDTIAIIEPESKVKKVLWGGTAVREGSGRSRLIEKKYTLNYDVLLLSSYRNI